MNGYGIGKREIYERIYIAIVALVILLCFLPCYELKEVRDGIPKITSSTQYKMKLLEDPDKAFAALMRYQGVTAVSYRYPVGFYIAAASIAMLFIVSVIGFFIPKDSDKVLL